MARMGTDADKWPDVEALVTGPTYGDPNVARAGMASKSGRRKYQALASAPLGRFFPVLVEPLHVRLLLGDLRLDLFDAPPVAQYFG